MAKHAKHTYQTYAQITKKRSRSAKRILWRIVGTLLILLLMAIVGLAVFLTVTEYHPADQEKVPIQGTANKQLALGEETTLLTWNIGYGALGDNASFFMDGGSDIYTADAARVNRNMAEFESVIQNVNPDIVLLQEVDRNSDRSYRVDQVKAFAELLPATESYFANNYVVALIPWGIPPYGKIDSGIQTISTFHASQAQRISLPAGYTWPVSAVQLKRCQLVVRIPIKDSTQELVLVNEHTDAYVSEEVHAAQMEAISKLLQEEAALGNYVIAGGDWNHPFPGVDLTKYPQLDENYWQPGHMQASVFDKQWQFAMDSTHPTSRLLNKAIVDENGKPIDEPIQYYMIDGFIVSDNIEIMSVETLDEQFKASDHNPVVMKVSLKGLDQAE